MPCKNKDPSKNYLNGSCLGLHPILYVLRGQEKNMHTLSLMSFI